MLSPSDIHQPDNDPLSLPPPPPSHNPDQRPSRGRFSPANTPHSDSGLSISSSSSGEIMGTPFDLGAQRFEYPFPQAQGSPTDSFLPLSSSLTSHSHAQLPPWPIHIPKSFPLTPPPLGKLKAHPKLRPASVREPPVPPGLVKRRSRIAGLQHQSSSEEPSDRSDVSDEIARARRSSRFPQGFTQLSRRDPPRSHDATSSSSEIIPIKQAASFPIGTFDRPSVEDPAGLAICAGPAQGTPHPLVLQRQERKVNRVREEIYSFVVYCWIVAGQLFHWVFHFLWWFSKT